MTFWEKFVLVLALAYILLLSLQILMYINLILYKHICGYSLVNGYGIDVLLSICKYEKINKTNKQTSNLLNCHTE